MGLFNQKVRLTNIYDMALSSGGYLPKDSIKSIEAEFLVATGAYMLCINEAIQSQLPYFDEEEVIMADDSRKILRIVGPVQIDIHNRKTNTNALVLPGESTPLLGAIPLEDMPVPIPYFRFSR